MSDDAALVPELDRTIHEPARLGIVSLLLLVDSADFVFVRQRTALTAGNLSAHLSKLEAAGYLEIEKAFSERRPLTTLRLSREGRIAFATYVDTMRRFLDAAVGPAGAPSRRSGKGVAPSGR